MSDSVLPGMSIFLLVLSFNLLGDGLRDAQRSTRGMRRRYHCGPAQTPVT